MYRLVEKVAKGAAFGVAVVFSVASPLLASSPSVASHQPLPLVFEENRGQAASDVRFVSRGHDGVLLLSSGELSLQEPGARSAFTMRLHGANTHSAIVGGEASGIVNYFHGSDPSKWLTNIQSYTEVSYQEVYPQIDWKVYGSEGRFESDFVVAAGANPALIQFEVAGNLKLGQDGSLSAKAAGGVFQLHAPFAYQLTASGERLPVDCHFTINGNNRVAFALGQYNHSKVLIIDPVLSYSTYLGGSGNDQILGISGDLVGNVYVTGLTTSLNFPTARPLQAHEAGGHDCFVAKFDPTGQHLLYSTYLGGSGDENCTSIAVNFFGEAFVGGSTQSTNFPTEHPIQGSLKGGAGATNGFLAHLDCTGSKLIFSTYLGGGGEVLTGVALDLESNVYATGLTNSTGFPVTPGAYQPHCGNGSSVCYDNAFLSKVSSDGSKLIYSTYFGGSTNYDSANGIAVDLTGSAYIAGEAHSSDFPTTTGVYQPKLAGPSNAFVAKFNPTGTALVYSTLVGGSSFDSGRAIALDIFGNAYVAGATSSTNFPTVKPFQAQYVGTGSPNIFIFKLNGNATALDFSTYAGGSQYNYPFAISVDLLGNAAIAGETTSPDFPVKSTLQTYAGGLDAVLLNVSSSGSLNYSTYLGGTLDDYGFAVYANPLCEGVWIGGVTYSTNYPIKNAFQSTPAGNGDAFLSLVSAH